MRYEARFTAFDMLDQVHTALVVTATDDAEPRHTEVVLSMTATLQGEGLQDPQEWARDALVAMLETL
jgi:hypothetical protein